MNTFEEQLLLRLNRIADALEGNFELMKQEYAIASERSAEYEAKHPDDEQQRHNDLWERQIKVNEERLEAEKLHIELHMRGTAHGEN